MSWLCKLGLHRWLYVVWPRQPFAWPPFAFAWRGCRHCHKDQYEYHPAGYHWAYTLWDDVPSLRFEAGAGQ